MKRKFSSEERKVIMEEARSVVQSKSHEEKGGVKNGIVGLFDILGYENFLAENSAEEAAHSVLAILLTIENELPRLAAELFGSATRSPITTAHLESIRYLVFSDTVLLTAQFDDIAGNLERVEFRWMVFAMMCSLLQRHMFDAGLPLRGAINTGEFIIEKSCFAGISIVEAHRLLVKLDLAACVFTAKASAEYARLPRLRNMYSPGLVKTYLVPFKGGSEQELEVVLPMLTEQGVFPLWPSDIGRLVLQVFSQHRKRITPDAMSKVRNTAKLLRMALESNPQGFE